jgi:negative regulator of flagellin synthesis FlgM
VQLILADFYGHKITISRESYIGPSGNLTCEISRIFSFGDKHFSFSVDNDSRERSGETIRKEIVMKINQFGMPGMNPYKKQIEKQQNLANVSKKQDKVEISSAAKEMQQATHISKERQVKIEALKQQVQNGTYQIDKEATVKGMIDFYLKK